MQPHPDAHKRAKSRLQGSFQPGPPRPHSGAAWTPQPSASFKPRDHPTHRSCALIKLPRRSLIKATKRNQSRLPNRENAQALRRVGPFSEGVHAHQVRRAQWDLARVSDAASALELELRHRDTQYVHGAHHSSRTRPCCSSWVRPCVSQLTSGPNIVHRAHSWTSTAHGTAPAASVTPIHLFGPIGDNGAMDQLGPPPQATRSKQMLRFR